MNFSFFSSNYKPKDFLGKTPEDILENMDWDKIDIKFFETYEKSDNVEFKSLSQEVKEAIKLVISVKKKDKNVIYNKCYKKNAQMSVAPEPAEVYEEEEEEEEANSGIIDGGRRKRKHTKKKHTKRKQTKRKQTKRKQTKKHKHTKKCKHSRK